MTTFEKIRAWHVSLVSAKPHELVDFHARERQAHEYIAILLAMIDGKLEPADAARCGDLEEPMDLEERLDGILEATIHEVTPMSKADIAKVKTAIENNQEGYRPPYARQAARYSKIGKDGELLPRDATAWEAVRDNRSGLTWPVKAVKVTSWKKAQAAAEKCNAGGFSNYRLPTVEELFCLADRTKSNPAIDSEFFPDCPSDWFWTSTVDCESPGVFAWCVSFGNGNSARYYQGSHGFVRAVCVGQ